MVSHNISSGNSIYQYIAAGNTGGGEFQIIDTSLKQMPRFGGRLGFNASRMAGGAKGYADVVNPETLYASWDRRLGKYYSDKYRVARTVKGKVV